MAKELLFAGALLVLLTGTASLARAESVKLTISETIDLLRGLNALDGYERVSKDGANEKVSIARYKFKGVGFVAAMAKATLAARAVNDEYQLARTVLIYKYAPDGKLESTSPQAVDFQKENLELLKQERTLDLTLVGDDEFNIPENPIPPSVLADLKPIRRDAK